eukprot:69053-Pelagomonas_calceolata.AAC.1
MEVPEQTTNKYLGEQPEAFGLLEEEDKEDDYAYLFNASKTGVEEEAVCCKWSYKQERLQPQDG